MSRTLTRTLTVPDGYDFAGTVGQLPMGRHDPCQRLADGVFWWVTRTPDGPATLSLRRDGAVLLATGYGPGAEWVVEQADAVAGLRDDVSGFAEVAARHPLVAQLARQHPGLRLPATGRVYERLLRTVLEQKVTGTEAYRAYAATVRYCH
ncbi:MAG: DNA-3-methyladenine glycosylase 2 family protein, partial [Micromonosporaceae bacterium]|nr:DNA-3-methyladenine glycosylase 2 family protein [Micromonosporaceae bacterium]